MRALKNSVFLLQSKNSSLRKTLTVLIDDDEAMALMNLTKLRRTPDLYRLVSYIPYRRLHSLSLFDSLISSYLLFYLFLLLN